MVLVSVSGARVGYWCVPWRLVVPVSVSGARLVVTVLVSVPVSVSGASVGKWCPCWLVVPVSVSGARVG